MEKGRFIVVYGVNGVGKTTQLDMLIAHLKQRDIRLEVIKYPIYDLEPEGPFLDKYLRDPEFSKENKLTTHELQKKYTDNRIRYEETLQKKLEEGVWIIAEDYIGTGIAWGLTWGGDLGYLEKINRYLLKPDLEILMHGNRFTTAIEKNHRNEERGERVVICKNFLRLLADKFKWKIINAQRKKEDVHRDMINIIDESLTWVTGDV